MGTAWTAHFSERRVSLRKGGSLHSARIGVYFPVILSLELDREEEGRWIAAAIEMPGVMSYGATREEAISNTEKLAIEVIADRIRHGELPPSAPYTKRSLKKRLR